MLRVATFHVSGVLIADIILGDDEPVISPEQAAHQALHADRVTRVKVYDLATGEPLIDREKRAEGHVDLV